MVCGEKCCSEKAANACKNFKHKRNFCTFQRTLRPNRHPHILCSSQPISELLEDFLEVRHLGKFFLQRNFGFLCFPVFVILSSFPRTITWKEWTQNV